MCHCIYVALQPVNLVVVMAAMPGMPAAVAGPACASATGGPHDSYGKDEQDRPANLKEPAVAKAGY